MQFHAFKPRARRRHQLVPLVDWDSGGQVVAAGGAAPRWPKQANDRSGQRAEGGHSLGEVFLYLGNAGTEHQEK